MHKQFFADVLARRPALWQRLLQANLPEGGPRLPDDCREQLGGAADSLWAWLQQRPLTHGPDAAESGPVVQASFWDYAEESRRLALLDAPALLELCRVTGVVLHAPAIATVLLRDEVLPLRESLGEETYQYALQRGRYQLGGVRRFFHWRDTDLPPGGTLCPARQYGAASGGRALAGRRGPARLRSSARAAGGGRAAVPDGR